MTYRSDLDARSARHAALEHDVAEATRDRVRVRQLLDEARAGTERAKLPLLAAVRVASPCSADWSAMTGDDRVRSCGACQQMVYHLSGMTRAEAEALITRCGRRPSRSTTATSSRSRRTDLTCSGWVPASCRG